MSVRTKIDKFGRVVIPKEVRDDLGLGPGSPINIAQGDGKITITPVSSDEWRLERRNGVLMLVGGRPGELDGFDDRKALEEGREQRDRRNRGE